MDRGDPEDQVDREVQEVRAAREDPGVLKQLPNQEQQQNPLENPAARADPEVQVVPVAQEARVVLGDPVDQQLRDQVRSCFNSSIFTKL